jgi:hypothetical protein
MKVICIRTSRHNMNDNLPLTVGKVYDVIEITHIPFNAARYDDYTGPIYKLENDRGEISGYTDDYVRGLTKQELRCLALEELGIY